MEFPMLQVTDIASKWATALENNQPLTDWCMAKYGKAPKIYIGLPIKNPPGEKECPYIIIRPGVSDEGTLKPEMLYSLSVGWAVKGTVDGTSAGRITTADGVVECDEMKPLVLDAISAAGAWPISSAPVEIECAEFLPQVVGFAEIQLQIPWLHIDGGLFY